MTDELINLSFIALSAFCEIILLFSLIEHLSEKRFWGIKQVGLKLLCTLFMTAVITYLDIKIAFFSFVTLLISSILPAFLAKLLCRIKLADSTAVSMVYYLIVTIGGILISYIIEMLIIPDFTVHVMTVAGWREIFIRLCQSCC